MRPKVSVIVPIYGVESYIEKCAESLFMQTLDNMEYIFVDDCTTDRSIFILKEVIKRFPERIGQIHLVRTPQNGGLPAARRYGMRFAHGEYIIHCDSDDRVEPDMYQVLYEKAKSGDYDMVTCDYFKSYDGNEMDKPAIKKVPLEKIALINAILRGKVHGSLWSKLVKSSVYRHEIVYPEKNMHEDIALSIQLVYYSTSFAAVNMPLYHYRIHEHSISHQKGIHSEIKKNRQSYVNFLLIESFLKEKGIFNLCEAGLLKRKYLLRVSLADLTLTEEGRKEWMSLFPELSVKGALLSKMTIRKKLRYLQILYGYYAKKRKPDAN